ncbi:MAG: isocitrate lyase/PEP mutase family protein, partial [Gammaproteobacteria bacterium]
SQIQSATPLLVPLVLNPLMARLAEESGFKALYLGGGSLGYQKAVLEANLNLSEMAATGLEIKTVSSLPLILDAAGGWGDPMHVRRTVAMAEAAGFAAIEIEDQLLPKRAHHHVGVEHMIPEALMTGKIREALAVRRSKEFLIIARTNAVRVENVDAALRRAETYRDAGADVILISPRNADEMRHVGERLAPPLMNFVFASSFARAGLGLNELGALGFRLLVDPTTPLLAAYRAWRQCYRELASGMQESSMSLEEARAVQDAMHATIGLETFLAVERETVEK